MGLNKNVLVEPPGKFIKFELEARGWSQRDLAFILGQTEQQLNPLLSGKRAMTPDMARLLGDAFDVAPQFFANLQTAYDLANAKEPDPAVKTRAALQLAYPVRDMIRRQWIDDTEGSLLQLQVDRFFERVAENDNEKIVAFAAKRTDLSQTPPSQLAWVYRVRQLARKINAPRYDQESLRQALPSLKALMINAEAVAEAIPILTSCGVRLVLVEVLPGAKIDGVCTWLSDVAPVIGLSTLHDRLDNFWFVLRHEIEHILEGHGKDVVGIVDNLSGDGAAVDERVSQEERIANVAAAEFCVPQDRMNSFFDRKYPYFSERDVIGLAATLGVHPALVVGQLQRRLDRYDYLRKYQVSVRKHLQEAVVFDGWGSVVTIPL